MKARWLGAMGTWKKLTEPLPNGLPNWRVTTWFPLAAVLLGIILIALQLSGTSSGMHWLSLGTGEDPRLLFGAPRAIRSDEWLVQQSWVVSQAANGFLSLNPTFPGGLDVTVFNELPSWDWSSLFRPHLWGYLLFGLDVGVAWHWWVPGIALVSGCYLFVVSVLPRRPLTAAMIAIAIFFTPLLQWWYTPSSVWPVAWAFLAMAAVGWSTHDSRLWVRVAWASIVGYTAITMAMGLYVPFILPGLYVVVAFGLGVILRARSHGHLALKRLVPLLAAAAASVVVVSCWVLTRLPTFQAIASTVYPGGRSQTSGALLANDPYLAGIGSAPWSQALKAGGATLMGGNSSESSSVFLLCVFLVPAMLWFTVRVYRLSRKIDWLLITALAILLIVIAFLFLPGWDALASVLQFQRVSPERFRIMFVVLLPLFAALTIEHVEKFPSRWNWIPGIVSALFSGGFIAALAYRFMTLDTRALDWAPTWIPVSIMLVCATFALFVRRLVPLAAVLLLLATALTTVNVNPIYRGVFDLRDTQIGGVINDVDSAAEGAWIGVGGYTTWALLVESGVESFSGVQTYPPDEMWDEIDPRKRFEAAWNRLAHVSWVFGRGEPTMTNPSADVVLATFDPCSQFAQENVSYILTDTQPVDRSCMIELAAVDQGNVELKIFRVARRTARLADVRIIE